LSFVCLLEGKVVSRVDIYIEIWRGFVLGNEEVENDSDGDGHFIWKTKRMPGRKPRKEQRGRNLLVHVSIKGLHLPLVSLFQVQSFNNRLPPEELMPFPFHLLTPSPLSLSFILKWKSWSGTPPQKWTLRLTWAEQVISFLFPPSSINLCLGRTKVWREEFMRTGESRSQVERPPPGGLNFPSFLPKLRGKVGGNVWKDF